MQMSYGGEIFFLNVILFIIEKSDFPVEIPPKKRVNLFLWTGITIFRYPKVYPFQKMWVVLPWAIFSYFGRFGEPCRDKLRVTHLLSIHVDTPLFDLYFASM